MKTNFYWRQHFKSLFVHFGTQRCGIIVFAIPWIFIRIENNLGVSGLCVCVFSSDVVIVVGLSVVSWLIADQLPESTTQTHVHAERLDCTLCPVIFWTFYCTTMLGKPNITGFSVLSLCESIGACCILWERLCMISVESICLAITTSSCTSCLAVTGLVVVKCVLSCNWFVSWLVSSVVTPKFGEKASWIATLMHVTNCQLTLRNISRLHHSKHILTLWRPLLGSAIGHPVPDRVKPSFVIFDIRALWRSWLSVRVPGCQKLQMTA